MICPKCGNQLPDGAAFCGMCGSAIQSPGGMPNRPGTGNDHEPTVALNRNNGYNGQQQYQPGQQQFGQQQYQPGQGFYKPQPSGGRNNPNRKKSKAPVIIAVVIASIAALVGIFFLVNLITGNAITDKLFYPSTPEKVAEGFIKALEVGDLDKADNYMIGDGNYFKHSFKYDAVVYHDDKEAMEEDLDDEYDTKDLDKAYVKALEELTEKNEDKYGGNVKATIKSSKKTKKYSKDEIKDVVDIINKYVDKNIEELNEVDPSLKKEAKELKTALKDYRLSAKDISEMRDVEVKVKVSGDDKKETNTYTVRVAKINGKWQVIDYRVSNVVTPEPDPDPSDYGYYY